MAFFKKLSIKVRNTEGVLQNLDEHIFIQNALTEKYVATDKWEEMSEEEKEDAALAEMMVYEQQRPDYKVITEEESDFFSRTLKTNFRRIQPTERFGKMLLKLPQNIQREVLETIENVQNATSFPEIKHLKALKGYPNFYRIPVVQYRLGLFWDGGKFIAEKIATRGDFYKGYPPK